IRSMAFESSSWKALRRSLACFLYCSRLGWRGSSRDSITTFLSFVPGVRSNQAERRSVAFKNTLEVGTALSADWMRPLALIFYIARSDIGRDFRAAVGSSVALRPYRRPPGRTHMSEKSLSRTHDRLEQHRQTLRQSEARSTSQTQRT